MYCNKLSLGKYFLKTDPTKYTIRNGLKYQAKSRFVAVLNIPVHFELVLVQYFIDLRLQLLVSTEQVVKLIRNVVRFYFHLVVHEVQVTSGFGLYQVPHGVYSRLATF